MAAAAGTGVVLGWRAAPRTAGTLHWRQGQWTLQPRGSSEAHSGSLLPVFDLGSWMLLKFAPEAGGPCRWLSADRTNGAAWHALRVTLFAPAKGAMSPRSAAPGPTGALTGRGARTAVRSTEGDK